MDAEDHHRQLQEHAVDGHNQQEEQGTDYEQEQQADPDTDPKAHRQQRQRVERGGGHDQRVDERDNSCRDEAVKGEVEECSEKTHPTAEARCRRDRRRSGRVSTGRWGRWRRRPVWLSARPPGRTVSLVTHAPSHFGRLSEAAFLCSRRYPTRQDASRSTRGGTGSVVRKPHLPHPRPTVVAPVSVDG